ncbi:BRO-N domain-containing protein [Burkholderia sp. 22313]|uniref:BRO-N domain-containing protein n=1 Tax=Burkholderia sp. 22313 TaxID=3453908 RepID=UPI003F85F10C
MSGRSKRRILRRFNKLMVWTHYTVPCLRAPFVFDGARVRVVTVDGEPWFVARDVADLLGYREPGLAVRTHCKGGVKRTIPSAGGSQETTLIPERDVYRLIMRSKLPAAERFEEWVVGDVLPSIRKTGAYVAPAAALPNFSDPVAAAPERHAVTPCEESGKPPD